MKRNWIWALIATGTAIGQGCKSDADGADDASAEMAAAVQTYASIARANYADALTATRDLDDAIQAFTDAPSADGLDAAKEAWLAAREPYGQTEVFRFYDGPIEEVEGLMNAWPMDEAYMDYVEGDETAGIINDPDKEITKAMLASFNEAGGEQNIATGYHALEFLLWGQDQNADGPGDRPFTDYSTGDDATASNGERRAQYLTTASELLIDNLEEVSKAWAQGEDNYRAEFESAEPAASFSDLLAGMTALSGIETGGERLRKALDSKDQEDEHSCFSDNTHRDMVTNVLGIQNILLGRYERLDGEEITGTGVYDVIAVVDADLADALRDKVADALEAAEALKAPFDQEIASDNSEGNARVRTLIDRLSETQELLEEAAVALDLTLKLPE